MIFNMKVKIVFVLSIFAFTKMVCCQTSCIDVFYFRSQEQIDSFIFKYPDCSVLDGSVTIFGGNITNTDSLYHIKKIKGDLVIHYGKRLKSIDGLKNCDTITGKLTINQNDSLFNFSAFNTLNYAKLIEITSNKNLTIIDGFDSIQNLEKLLISGNSKLRNIYGFNQLKVINVLNISLNRKSKEINGFHNLQDCGVLSISNNDSLSQMLAFNSLIHLNSLFIAINNSLLELDGLQKLKSIAGDCQFSSLSNLEKMSEMDSLEYIGGFFQFSNLGRLKTLPKFKKLKRVDGSLHISECGSLNAVSAFDALRVIKGQFLMRNNSSITSINGFRALDSCLYNFVIDGGNKLKVIDGFDNLKYIEASLTLNAFDLESINGFWSLHEIRGDQNGDSTQWINFALQTGKVKSISEFSNLKKVRGILLNRNQELDNIVGFDNVDTSYIKFIKFANNEKLTLCKSDFLCSYLENPNHEANLSGNAPGCNTREEILASCTSGTQEWHATITANGVYPNPCPLNTTLWFEGWEADFDLSLYNSMGSVVYKGAQHNPVSLPVSVGGMYFYKVQAAGKSGSGAVVVTE